MEEYPECPICLDIYGANQSDVHGPKVLKCGDTLCKECLEKIIKKDDEEIFNCPICNQKIKKEENIEEYTTNKEIIRQINSLFNIPSEEDENNDENRPIKYNIILLGNSGVGKTSILKRLSDNKFFEFNSTTIGCDSSLYYVKYKNKKYHLALRDPSGQEKYKAVTRSFFRNTDGVLFVFDISVQKTFIDLPIWYNLYKEENEKIVGLLIGNKCDLKHKVNKNESEEFAKEHGLHYMETSASSDKNIKKAIVCLLKKIKESKILYDSLSSIDTHILLQPTNNEKNEEPKKKKKCRC